MLGKNFILVCGACVLSFVNTQSVAQESASTLSLMCVGSGTLRVSETSTTKLEDDNDITNSATAETQTMKLITFKGTAYIEINGTAGRMQLPDQLIGTFSNSKGGWFDIQDLVMAERDVTGRIRMNMLHRSKLKIDRFSGVVTLGDEFTGQCERMENVKPKF